MKLVKTCSACPEQYDAYDDDGNVIAYLRLRHGNFTVYLNGPDGYMIYSAYPEGDGIFEEDERTYYLNNAVSLISQYKRIPLEPNYSIEDS